MADHELVPQGFVDFAFEVMKRAGDIRSLRLNTRQLISKINANAAELGDEKDDELRNLIEIAACAMVMGVEDET